MTYTISMVMTGHDNPGVAVRQYWDVITGTPADILVSIAGAVTVLQSLTMIRAVPVSPILLPSLWCAARITRELAHKQEIVKQ